MPAAAPLSPPHAPAAAPPAVLFSLFESGLDYVDLDRYVPGNYSATPALAGMATGALYKSRACRPPAARPVAGQLLTPGLASPRLAPPRPGNPRTAVLASVAGGSAAAAYSAFGHYIPSPLSFIF